MKRVLVFIILFNLSVESYGAETIPKKQDVANHLIYLRNTIEDASYEYKVVQEGAAYPGQAVRDLEYEYLRKIDKFKYTLNFKDKQGVEAGEHRAVWDGELYKTQGSPTTAFIWPTVNESDAGTNGGPFENACISFRPSSADNAPASFADLAGLMQSEVGDFMNQRQQFNDVNCLVYEIAFTTEPYTAFKYYLDESKGFAVIGLERIKNNDVVFSMLNEDFIEAANGVWVPAKNTRSYFEESGENKGQIKYSKTSTASFINVNTNIEDSRFTLPLEDGITVVDKVLGMKFKVVQGQLEVDVPLVETKDIILEKSKPDILNTDDQLDKKVPVVNDEASENSTILKWIGLTLIIVLVIGIIRFKSSGTKPA